MPKTITDIIIKIPAKIMKIAKEHCLNRSQTECLAQIDYLNNKDGCTATNAFLATYLGKTKNCVQKIIAKLVEIGLVVSDIKNHYQRTLKTVFEKVAQKIEQIKEKIESTPNPFYIPPYKNSWIYNNKKQYKSFNNKVEEKQVLSLKLYQSSFTTIEEFETYCTEQEKRTDVIVDRIYSKLDKVSSNNSISALQQMKNGFNKIKLSCQNV